MNEMTTMNPYRRALALGLAGLCAGVRPAAAQDRPLTKLVVPFPAGGVTDLSARSLARVLEPELASTVIVDNRPGAGTRIGVGAVATARPDGRTLLLTNIAYSALPVIDPKARVNPLETLTPVAMVAKYGVVLVVDARLPVKTLQEFIKYARTHGDALSYGSAGVGSGSHFMGEHFKSITHTRLNHIPYRSTSLALRDVAGGLVSMAFDGNPGAMIDAGSVRPLAVTGTRRDPRFPTVPTTTEAGVPDFVVESWMGLLAPPGMPSSLVASLQAALKKVAANPELKERFRSDIGTEPSVSSQQEFIEQLRTDVDFYRRVARENKLVFD